jgi:hypothetical protein
MTPEGEVNVLSKLNQARTNSYITTIAVVALLAINLISLHRGWSSEGAMEQDVESAERRAHNASVVADSLRARADSALHALENADALSLKLSLQIDSINEQYHDFVPTLSNAGSDELRRMADSILAGYDINRHRYLVLLRARSPGDVEQHGDGPGGDGAPGCGDEVPCPDRGQAGSGEAGNP